MAVSLAVILLILLIGSARRYSERVIVTLFLNAIILCFSVFLLLLGFGTLISGIFCIGGTTMITLFYQNGVNRKTTAAFISTVIVLLLSALLIGLIYAKAGLGGLDERNREDDIVNFLDLHLHINMLGVMTVVLLLSVLGAVKDSSIAVASGVYELHLCNRDIAAAELFRSGMSIGRDILGVSINTLFFAAAGQSLLLIQMYFEYHYTFAQLINSKSLLQAAVIVLSGGIGIELSVPITALIMSLLCTGRLHIPAGLSASETDDDRKSVS